MGTAKPGKSTDKGLMTQAQYARHRGVSREAVRLAVRDGRIRTGRNGRIDPKVADKQWAENTDPSTPRNSVSGQPAGRESTPARRRSEASDEASYAESRAKRESYLAELARMECEERAGALLSAEDVREAAYRTARAARDLILALPDRLAPIVAGLDDQEACHRAITEEVRRVCDDLSRPVLAAPAGQAA